MPSFDVHTLTPVYQFSSFQIELLGILEPLHIAGVKHIAFGLQHMTGVSWAKFLSVTRGS